MPGWCVGWFVNVAPHQGWLVEGGWLAYRVFQLWPPQVIKKNYIFENKFFGFNNFFSKNTFFPENSKE